MPEDKLQATIEPETVIHDGIPDEARPGHVVTSRYPVAFVGGHPFTVDPDQQVFEAGVRYTVETWARLQTENRGEPGSDHLGPRRTFYFRRVGDEQGRPQFIIRP